MDLDEKMTEIRAELERDLKQLRRSTPAEYYDRHATSLLAQLMRSVSNMNYTLSDYAQNRLTPREFIVFGHLFLQTEGEVIDLTTRRKRLAEHLELTERSVIRVEDGVIAEFAEFLTKFYMRMPDTRRIINTYIEQREAAISIGSNPDIAGVVVAQAAMIEQLADGIAGLSRELQQLRRANSSLARLVGVPATKGPLSSSS